MNINNNLTRGGWVLIVRRPELSHETWEMKVKEIIIIDTITTMVRDLETIVAKFKKEEKGCIDLEFQVVPLVIAGTDDILNMLNKIVSEYNVTNPIHADEFTIRAGEIIQL